MTNVQKLLAKTSSDCLKYNISFKLINEPFVLAEGFKVSGYFDENELVVATGKQDWIDVLVHESCHLDQWIEKSPLWNKADSGLSNVDSWIKGKSFSEKKITQSFKDTILLELDCEKRTVKKIKKFKLDISVPLYRKQANSYLFSYWATYRDRKWYPFPYNNTNVYKGMPADFLPEIDYLDQTTPFLKLFK